MTTQSDIETITVELHLQPLHNALSVLMDILNPQQFQDFQLERCGLTSTPAIVVTPQQYMRLRELAESVPQIKSKGISLGYTQR